MNYSRNSRHIIPILFIKKHRKKHFSIKNMKASMENRYETDLELKSFIWDQVYEILNNIIDLGYEAKKKELIAPS